MLEGLERDVLEALNAHDAITADRIAQWLQADQGEVADTLRRLSHRKLVTPVGAQIGADPGTAFVYYPVSEEGKTELAKDRPRA